MTEEAKKPGFIDRLFGYNPEVTRIKLEKIRKANEEIAAINTALEKSMATNLKRQKAAIETELAVSRAENDRAHEQLAHRPIQLDQVEDMNALIEGRKKGESIVAIRNRTTVYKWDDGDGNIIYLSPSVEMSQVKAVSARITEQQKSFSILELDEKTKARNEFGSAKGMTTSPYQDFLASEARRVRFQELKQPHTDPK